MRDKKSEKIQPLPIHNISIHKESDFQDILIRRYTKIQTFRFSLNHSDGFSIFPQFQDSPKTESAKLLKALKILKPVKKFDPSEYFIKVSSIKQSEFFSIFKQSSKIHSLSITKDYYKPESLNEKWFKYLPSLKNLAYQLTNPARLHRLPITLQSDEVHNILDDLKYCPKVESLRVETLENNESLKRSFIVFERFPPSLKHLSIDFLFDQDFLNLSLLKNLTSIQLNFHSSYSNSFIVKTMNSISKLPQLQEIDLKFDGNDLPSWWISQALQNITERGILKKFKLSLTCKGSELKEVLKSLRPSELFTHFSLSVYIFNDDPLLAISDCLRKMHALEYLKLRVDHDSHFKKSCTGLLEIFKQISSLQALKYLKLSLKNDGTGFKQAEIEGLISSLHHALKNLINLETLSLTCCQTNPARAFPTIILALAGPIASALQKLKLNLTSPKFLPLGEFDQALFIQFLTNLKKIQALKVPFFEILTQEFLKNIVEGVCALKSLQTLKLGRVKSPIISYEFTSAVETILKKKGLRKFKCVPAGNLDKHNVISGIDLKKMMKMNPSLEEVYLSVHHFCLK